MARGTQLHEVIDMVLDEARMSSNASRGPDYRNYVKRLIIRHQRTLYDGYYWPFMELKHADGDIALVAGTRYYNFPDKLDLEGAIRLWHEFGTIWIELDRGINMADYSAYNSDDDDRADPALKWDSYDETQFEIWPIPASAGTVRFEGRKKLNELIDEDDTLDLDDELVALHCAAEILASNKQADAGAKQEQARTRLTQLRANLSKKKDVRMGLGESDNSAPPNRKGWPRHIAVWNDT